MVENWQVALLVVAVIVIVVGIWKYRSSRDHFTRTCLTADTNCEFVRSPVDYIWQNITEVPEKMGKPFPHLIANLSDELQPLDANPINLIKDEDKLWNPDLLWKQYENNWQGCGNNQPYIVNDEKTRFLLSEVGNQWAHRILDDMRVPAHGPVGKHPALTDIDFITPEPFTRQYGGPGWLPFNIGYS